jgi:hypothetical protein
MQKAVSNSSQDNSPDHDDRLQDFFARHGGPNNQENREGASAGGTQGWCEVYAGDGYALRCDWSAFGTRKEMTYSEVPPAAAGSPREPADGKHS